MNLRLLPLKATPEGPVEDTDCQQHGALVNPHFVAASSHEKYPFVMVLADDCDPEHKVALPFEEERPTLEYVGHRIWQALASLREFHLVLALSLFPTLTLAQGVPIKGGATSDLANVNTNKALEVVDGKSSRPTYIASVGAQATTAAYVLSVESGASTGFKLVKWCVGASSATAAAAVTVTVQRRTTASSGGTALTNEGTGTTAISKFDPADGNYPGVARLGGTPGTAGAVLDQVGFTVGEIGAGTADGGGPAPFCKVYGDATGEKPIVVASGTANGLTINVSAPGAGGLAAGSISATLIAE